MFVNEYKALTHDAEHLKAIFKSIKVFPLMGTFPLIGDTNLTQFSKQSTDKSSVFASSRIFTHKSKGVNQ